MRWFNLKNNKCPQCGKDWALDLTIVDGLLVHGCGFKIRESRYKEIVSDMTKKNLDSYFDEAEKKREEME